MRHRYHQDASKAKRVHDTAYSAKSGRANYATNVMLIIGEIQNGGVKSLWTIADALNARGISGARGGKWYATTVRNFLERNKAAARTGCVHPKPQDYGARENVSGTQGGGLASGIARTRPRRRVRTRKERPGKAFW
jgi:Recombinase